MELVCVTTMHISCPRLVNCKM